MLELLHAFLTSSPFIPHGHCYLWNPGLVWLHLLSDSLIALAYYSIPVTLLYFVHKRKDVPFKGIFLLFGAFIIACGTTHLMEVWTLWYPIYWLSGSIKAITAIVSVYTALMLVELVPTALQIPSIAQLEAANQKLQQEITARQQAEAALRKAHDQLEIRVQKRTAELLTANAALQAEIAERQRAEAALRDTTTLQRAILDSANYTIISTTEDGIILTFNAAAERWLGYAAQEVVGKTTPVIIHDSDEVVKAAQELSQELGVTIKPGFEAFVARARRGQVDEREWYYIRKDGSRFPVLLSVTALRDAENNITGFLGIGSDITDRKQAEEALRQSEATLRSFFDSAPMMMGVVEIADDDILHISDNLATAKLFGRTPEAMHNQLASEMGLPQKYISLWIEHYRQAERTHSPVRFEYAHETSTGNRWLSATVAAISSDGSSSRPRFSYIVEDISDRREVERLKDEFVSVVSHELRTPLTSISGALDLLASGILQTQPEDAQRMLNIAAKNTDRLVRLINDILDIERIESGKVQMTKQTCDAADLIIQSTEVMEEMAEQAGVTLSVSPLSVPLWADPDRIIQVLTNLLSNAIKFSPIGSTVWLSAELGNGQGAWGIGHRKDSMPNSQCPIPNAQFPTPHILFQVRDQGRGIPADKLESIFERFGQVDASDSRQKGGTGLGLAICRSILQHHGGQIWAESTLGEGSTFFFTVPILSEEDTGTRRRSDVENLNESFSASARLMISASAKPPLVLECDDDPSVRVVVQTTLERQGYRVMTVASGQEAVEQATANQPDAIILNLRMPGMDGWETLAILKQQPHTQNIPVIILSGLLPDTSQSLPEGVSDWIVKPPDFKLLCQALEKATAKQNQTIKVLIIEDDQDLAQVLIAMFNSHGIVTFYAQTGRKAIQVSQNVIPDLLVLDLGLPECDGFAVVDWLRQHNRLCQVPLVVYTARDLDESDRERLRLGQTLFLTKGRITPQEFEQRVINLLNRMIRGKDEES